MIDKNTSKYSTVISFIIIIISISMKPFINFKINFWHEQ